MANRKYEFNGKVVIRTDNSEDALCVHCMSMMPRVYVSHDGVPVLTGYGPCKCKVPEKYR